MQHELHLSTFGWTEGPSTIVKTTLGYLKNSHRFDMLMTTVQTSSPKLRHACLLAPAARQ